MGHLGAPVSLQTNVSGKRISSPKISPNADHNAQWLGRNVSAVMHVACKIVKAVEYFIKSIASFFIEAFVTSCKYIYQCLTSPFASTQTYADITQSAPTVTAFTTEDELIHQFPHYTFNTFLNALKALENMKEKGNEAQGYELTGKLYTCKERAFAEVKLSNGYQCFMYRSSGKGSGNESHGEWIPFPGWYMGHSIPRVIPHGWVIKGEKVNKFDKYQVPVFQRVANDLKAREKQLFPDFKHFEIPKTVDEDQDIVLQ